MRYIVSREILNRNISVAQSLIGQRTLSLMFKEYYESLYSEKMFSPTGEIFSVNLPGSICYALGKAGAGNKGALVNVLSDAKSLYDKGVHLFYVPIDAHDGREGLSIYEARLLTDSIHQFLGEDVEVRGMITNGCVNSFHIEKREEWIDLWQAFEGHITGLSVGGSYWLDKTCELPDFVNDIRIGRFMLFGYIPYSDKEYGKNSMVLEGIVLGVNLSNHTVMVDIGDAYCDPSQCEPYQKDLSFYNTSSNYALFRSNSQNKYFIGQKLYFTPNYKHSSALARINVKFNYE